MNYEIIIRTWLKTVSNEDFKKYEITLMEELNKEKARRGIN